MPSIDTDTSISWADQVEAGEEDDLPPPSEDYDEATGIKKVTEYKINEDGKKVKVVKTYRVETRRVFKTIAKRKTWRKFGLAANDPPGPNPANTVLGEEVYMVFVHNKEVQDDSEEDPLAKLKGQKLVSCRICKGDHWTTKCPYKDTLGPIQETLAEGDKAPGDSSQPAQPAPVPPPKVGGKYVPPSLREGAKTGKGDSMLPNKRGDEAATIRVTNLSEDTREADLQELFRPFGAISRIYLAKDKNTGQSKGFAFINFHRREDAARAIKGVSGFGYDHLILKVEWAKPSGTQ
ncbi:eukaryotic translation initiation factor 3 subunit G-like [Lingula anatina]|uniref:Eukaryotic translation initiation factor 3 subunit G n=1 Tax=Lingula anatina TaxID=7574 RepID=A0A1S3JUV0_LINAN|nr:eukaryotic translation initiation factor 3 subunit G [Lingula anatina]XP_013420088.1 eukaryotic translation initiation factor 3 subunit G-like [Lingula anatina]|eukprot:XP_013414103.1 eukaryotic translation initiation factor 3 subunit G [Lingula anatina]